MQIIGSMYNTEVSLHVLYNEATLHVGKISFAAQKPIYLERDSDGKLRAVRKLSASPVAEQIIITPRDWEAVSGVERLPSTIENTRAWIVLENCNEPIRFRQTVFRIRRIGRRKP